jgi:hypothetical protein
MRIGGQCRTRGRGRIGRRRLPLLSRHDRRWHGVQCLEQRREQPIHRTTRDGRWRVGRITHRARRLAHGYNRRRYHHERSPRRHWPPRDKRNPHARADRLISRRFPDLLGQLCRVTVAVRADISLPEAASTSVIRTAAPAPPSGDSYRHSLPTSSPTPRTRVGSAARQRT